MDLLVLQTGGTIDKDYPRVTMGYAFEIGDPASKRILERVKVCGHRVSYSTICRKDSQEITQEDREKIAVACKEASEDKILITHGTDTIIESAKFLSGCEIENKTIVLTGAFKPETFKDSEAEFNIGVAMGALQCLAETGVYVAMNGRVFACHKVARNMNTGEFITGVNCIASVWVHVTDKKPNQRE